MRIVSIVAVMFGLMVGGTAGAQTIRLKERASVVGGDVTLGDIATVSNADRGTAEGLLATIILPGVTEPQKIRGEHVLLAVVSQHGTGLAKSLQLTGAAVCDLQVEAARVAPAAVVERLRAVGPARGTVEVEASPASETAATTLAKVLSERIVSDLQAAEEDVRIRFETITTALDRAPKGNEKWVVRSLTRSVVGTLQFEAQLLDGPRVLQKVNIQAKVQRRVAVVQCVAPITRGDIVTADMVKAEDAWLDRALPTLFSKASDIIGQEAQRPVAVGAMLDQRDFRAAEMAAKGEIVRVLFSSGGLKVEMKARAMESGKLGDSIQLRNETTGETYQATLTAKREAQVGA